MNDNQFDDTVRNTSVADASSVSTARSDHVTPKSPHPDVAMANKRLVNLVERGKSVPLLLGVFFPSSVVPRVNCS